MFRTVNNLQKALGQSSLRHSVLSNNLANSNTPGFKRADVPIGTGFERRLQTSLARQPLTRTHAEHLDSNRSLQRQHHAQIIPDNSTSMRNDGNNVDPDREMVLVMENQLYYQAMADAVSRKLTQLRMAIGEGR